jgi:hypothetical protein
LSSLWLLAAAGHAADTVSACPATQAKLKSEAFDDRYAMCALYGNFEPSKRASRVGVDTAQVILSSDYTEEGVRKHALVVGVQLADPCATCTGTAHIYVYRHEAAAWSQEKHRVAAAAGGGLGAPPSAELVRMGPERLGVKLHGHSNQSGQIVDTDVIVGLYGEALHAITPVFGGRSNRPCAETPTGGSTIACDERQFSFQFVPGADPVWHDLVVTELWRRREQGRREIVPIDHETRFVYRGAAYAQVSPAPEAGALTRWTGKVGDAPMDLALLQSPTRVVGTFRHAQGSGFLRGDAAGAQVDEMRGGTWTGTFAGKIDARSFAGSWRKPNGRTEVPFSFTRMSTSLPGALAGSYASTDASITLGEPAEDQVEVTGTSLWGAHTLSGKHPYDGEWVRYDDGKCKLILYQSADVLVVQQLTERCGPAGTFDSLDVGPYFRK